VQRLLRDAAHAAGVRGARGADRRRALGRSRRV
jgi:hypothetical protein